MSEVLTDHSLHTVAAIDPGDKHQGIFVYGVDVDKNINILSVFEATAGAMFEFIESMKLDALVIESYHLYLPVAGPEPRILVVPHAAAHRRVEVHRAEARHRRNNAESHNQEGGA